MLGHGNECTLDTRLNKKSGTVQQADSLFVFDIEGRYGAVFFLGSLRRSQSGTVVFGRLTSFLFQRPVDVDFLIEE